MDEGPVVVLIVDDHNELRELATVIVEELGYRAICARNGREALQVIRNGGRIDLLLTDIMMPGGLDGFALARAAKAIRPALKVIYATGYSSRAPEERGQTFGPLIDKPYRPSHLAAEIKRALDGG